MPVTPGKTDDDPEEPNGHLTVNKVTTSTPANGETYALGETIEYKVTVTNDGNLTITDVTVTDELTEGEWTVESLAPGASEDFETSYVVTEADILAGEVLNVATAKGTSPDPDKPDVPVTPGEDPEPTDDPKPSLSSEKSSTGTMTGFDAEGNPAYAEGDTLTYTITVTNDGNLTASDITVVDEKLGYTEAAPLVYEGEIAPGETVTVLEAEYTVTADDVEAGSVLNVATVTGTTEGGDPDPVNPKDEQPVEVIFTIIFDPNGGTFADGSTENVIVHAKYNEVITIIDAPTREGYTFLYWKGSEYQPGDSYTVTGDHTFVAQWETEAQPEPKPADVLPKTSDPTAYTAMAYAAATGLSAIATGLRLRRRRRKEDEA